MSVTATLGYDGQGDRVIRQMADETRLYLEDWFESDIGFNYTCYSLQLQHAANDSQERSVP